MFDKSTRLELESLCCPCMQNATEAEYTNGGNSFYFRVDKKSSINNIRLVIKDQYNEIIPNFKDYNIILQVTKRKQINIVHKFLEVICEYLSQLMVLFGFVYESKLS